ncbi:hypothetical protein OF83DRAFT_431388 [Amylostereum chailletii]|nr:hypothetical protein OF83DRAFT_431388 [Amylostereum chailletii]
MASPSSSSIPLASIRTSHFLSEDVPSSASHPDHDIIDAFPRPATPIHEGVPLPAGNKGPSWKRDLFALLEHPTSSYGAFIVHVFTTGLIVLSALVTILETVPAFHSIPEGTWFGLETSLVALFTVEYVARCVAWSFSWKSLFQWVGSFFGIIDLLAIVPYYVEIALQKDTSTLFRFSILRTFRLLRVFRPFRYNSTLLLTIEVMFLSFRRSQHALLALSFFVIMVLVVFSTLLYFIERGSWDETLETFINSDGDPSQFASIPAAAWFVIVTITTVGYGEITPRSFLGRLITLPLLVFGLLLIALPSFVLGREFSIVWNDMTHGEQNPQTPHLVPDSPTFLRHFSEREPLSSRPGTRRSMEGNGSAAPDLTNRKLAQNQTELSRQIGDLRAAMERQSEMLRVLLERESARGRDS